MRTILFFCQEYPLEDCSLFDDLPHSVSGLYVTCHFYLESSHVPRHHGVVHPRIVDVGDGLRIWRVAANTLYKQSWTASKGDTQAWG
jgi:hypothetical protein